MKSTKDAMVTFASQHLRYNDMLNAYLATNRTEIVVAIMRKFGCSLKVAMSACAKAQRIHTGKLIKGD